MLVIFFEYFPQETIPDLASSDSNDRVTPRLEKKKVWFSSETATDAAINSYFKISLYWVFQVLESGGLLRGSVLRKELGFNLKVVSREAPS